MVKRRQTIESDESEEEERSVTPPNKRAKNSRRGKHAAPDVEIKEDVDMVEEDAEGEEEAEWAHQDVRAAINGTSGGRGTIAEAGVIQQITLKDFMCHRHLVFDFGPKINFITGRNGSGKSAVLSAIQIALGARTYLTGRGSSLKNFVKSGRESAEVIIKLKNGGPEAFRPDVFGKSITISRKISAKDGNGTWKILNEQGKTVSTTKREVQDMSDHMNLQIDSPLNVLTQDASRQFLIQATPSDKYAFFLKGTQLQQLSEEYELVMENIKKTDKALQQKKEIIPQLREAAREAQEKLAEAHKAQDQSRRVKELKKELAWSHVDFKRKQLNKEEEEHAKLTKRLPSIQKHLNDTQTEIAKIAATSRELEQSQVDEQHLARLEEEKKELNATIRVKRAKFQEYSWEEKTMSTSLTAVQDTIRDLDQKIAAENAKLHEEEAEKRAKIVAELEGVRRELGEKEERATNLRSEGSRLEALIQDIGNQGRQADQDRVKTLKDIDDNRAWMDNILASEKNKLNVYGKDTEAIIAAIEQTQWTGSARPIGPLGQYVTLTNSTYQPLFQAVIGSAMFQYAVTNEADRKKLADILKRNGQQNPRIIMGEPDLFDYSQGRPKDSTIVTPLDVLEISDQWVVRILINAYGVERIGLTKTRAEAERRAGEDPGRMFWAAELHRVQKYTDGGWSSQTITPVSGRDPRRSLFHSGGSAGSMEKARQRDGDLQHKLQTIDNILSDLRSRQATTGHALDECKKSWKALSENIRSLKHRKEELEELSKEEAPVMVAALEATRQQQLDEIENIKAQFAEVERKRQKTSEELKPLAERTNALREQINVAEQERNTINQQLQELSDKTAKAINDERHYQEKLDQAQADILRQQEKLNITQQEVDLWTEKASQYCEEVPNPRKTDIIQKEIEALEKALKVRARRTGATVDEMEEECNRTKRAVQDAEARIAELQRLNDLMRASVQRRMVRWHEFRRAIAVRAKFQFSYHLSTRNYTGKIVFDHTTCTLDVRVQTEDQTLMTKQARQKDTKALSGGEKSYATICLLLALWESVGSPIRCLDEYDVFMDGINRLVATKLMIDSAKSSEAKQYIFISPLDVCNYIENPREVKINRMPDPDRGGGQTSIDT